MRWLNNTNDAADTHLFRQDQDDTLICPSCAHPIHFQLQGGFEGFPAGVKFDPNDQEILEHLEAKVKRDNRKLHPLIDQFIPTLDGDHGICYTHPQNLPDLTVVVVACRLPPCCHIPIYVHGMRKDGEMRHFFHRASKAYTAGTRKRRKVQTEEQGTDIRWHKTGKTRPVIGGGIVIGFKKILVLYSNYGSQQKPQKTNWIMHQYHLGLTEHEKDGQFVASKVFFQKHPRQTSSSSSIQQCSGGDGGDWPETAAVFVDYGNPIMSSMYEMGGGVGVVHRGFGSVLGEGTHSTDSTRHTS